MLGDQNRVKADVTPGSLPSAPAVNADPVLNEIAAAAAAAAGTTVGLVSFLDDETSWVIAHVGADGAPTRRESAFCAWAVHNAEVMWVEDALADPRFHDNPFVVGEPYIRFYAGAPVATPDGARIGVVCVTDGAPRRPDPTLETQLKFLAERASKHLHAAVKLRR